MESQTLTSATLSRSESQGSLINERSSDTLQSPSTVRVTYTPRLESNVQNKTHENIVKHQQNTEKSEKIFLLPGTERVVKVTKKFVISNDNNNKQYTGDENDVFIEDDAFDDNKTQLTTKIENKYYKTNVSLRKRHQVSHGSDHRHHRRHYHHHHQSHRHSSYHPEGVHTHSSDTRDFRESLGSNGYKKHTTPSVLSSTAYNQNNLDQKRVISRLEFIANERNQSDINENGNTSGEGYIEMNRDRHSYVTSPQSKPDGLMGFKQSQLFSPTKNHRKKKHRSNSERKSYENSHSSLNRLYSHTPVESSICQKCHGLICSKCHESLNCLNTEHSECRPLHRVDAYCNSRLNGISCSLDHVYPLSPNQKYKSLSSSRMQMANGHHHHHHHNHCHRQISFAKSIPSLSTLDLYDTHPDHLSMHSLGSSRMEIEYMQSDNDETTNMVLSPEKLRWITTLARESLNKTRDLDTLAKMMKESLDERCGKLWHSIVGAESYGSNLATLPGALVSFRIDKWAFLLWQT
ncbi:unnamed protein product [Heterobilharzia americana]|nr:unnamed protein product [Heterobilharzia americana]CAH8561241.1 unnamed protein product [Heterobilharzia americana]